MWGNFNATNPPAYSLNGSTWSEGYAGVWHMTESDARDSTVYGHGGTAVNNVSNTNGVVATGQEFVPNARIDVNDTTDNTVPRRGSKVALSNNR